jgi:hypothetical protein
MMHDSNEGKKLLKVIKDHGRNLAVMPLTRFYILSMCTSSLKSLKGSSLDSVPAVSSKSAAAQY